VEHQEEHVTFTRDGIVIVRNAVQTLDQKACDVTDRLLTVQPDACLSPNR
jgi:hypothetical protein